MALFAYHGDHEETTVFGLSFPFGEPVEVTDERAARKLANNRDFVQVVDGVQIMPDQPKRRGRPPKAQ